MDETEEQANKISAQEVVVLVAAGVALSYGVYGIGKLGYDWSVEGIRTLRNRKNKITK